MKKLVIIGLLAAFTIGCTRPEINEEIAEYGTKKSESVNTEGDGSEYEHDNTDD